MTGRTLLQQPIPVSSAYACAFIHGLLLHRTHPQSVRALSHRQFGRSTRRVSGKKVSFSCHVPYVRTYLLKEGSCKNDLEIRDTYACMYCTYVCTVRMYVRILRMYIAAKRKKVHIMLNMMKL